MKLLPVLALLLPLAYCLPSLKIGTLQSSGVKGVLMCNGKPAVNVKVKLYDDDRGIDLDDLMDEGVTDAEGKFELKGSETEITTIDPKLNVYHDCNDETVPCLKKFSIMLPDSYVSQGAIPSKLFDVGTINLEGKFSGETRDLVFVLFAVFTLVNGIPKLLNLGKTQSVAVKGQLLCNDEPMENVKVKLYDVDTVDMDDLMAEGRTSANGTFELSGSETEITKIDPKLNIYHNCNDQQRECLRKFSIIIPDSYITEGKEAERTFDAGILNLSAKFPGETRDCIN
uniref:Transthyretin-like family protein n=1 Tax=Syphacia muris TaxID=451379 RepID=A0A158R5Z8_9BILA